MPSLRQSLDYYVLIVKGELIQCWVNWFKYYITATLSTRLVSSFLLVWYCGILFWPPLPTIIKSLRRSWWEAASGMALDRFLHTINENGQQMRITRFRVMRFNMQTTDTRRYSFCTFHGQPVRYRAETLLLADWLAEVDGLMSTIIMLYLLIILLAIVWVCTVHASHHDHHWQVRIR